MWVNYILEFWEKKLSTCIKEIVLNQLSFDVKFFSRVKYIYIYVRGKNGDVFRLKRWKKVCGRKEVFHDFVCSCCHMQYWSSWLVNWTGRWEQRVKRFPFWSWVTLYVPTQTVLYCSTRIEPAYSVCLTFRAHTPNTLIDRI